MNETIRLKDTRLFLNVERSALGRQWRDRCDSIGQAQALAISQIHGLGDLLSRILAGRQVDIEAAEHFLDPTLKRLMPDPFCLLDMEASACRLARAVLCGEKIAIFGDYDVDGAASAALLGCYFQDCRVPFIIHIPDRIFEGYGPNEEAIRALAKAGATLLVTVDCGTTSHAPLAEARRLGMDVIVLDHHQANEILPEALVVNPNRRDDLSGLGQLCAAGVTFMLLVALNRALSKANFFASGPGPDLLLGLDLVALATIADVAQLTGLNRAFVQKGIKVMQGRGRPGLTALFDIAGTDGPPKPYHLGFLIGPRINAGGRIGDAALGAKLLTLTDEVQARQIAEELDKLNRERQEVEACALAEAEAQVLGLEENSAVILVAQEGWHPGVVGLVATRLKDKFKRPAFAIAFNNSEIGTGSARSIPGVDLGAIVRQAVEERFLLKGGGHFMAAGLTITRDRLPPFRAFLQAKLADAVEKSRAGEALFIDAALTASGANPALMNAIERAGPYGAGNPEPMFVLPAHRLLDIAPVGTGHLRFRAQAGDGSKIEGIAFRAQGEPLGNALLAANGKTCHLAGSLSLDRWGGRERVKFRLVDLAPVDNNGGRL